MRLYYLVIATAAAVLVSSGDCADADPRKTQPNMPWSPWGMPSFTGAPGSWSWSWPWGMPTAPGTTGSSAWGMPGSSAGSSFSFDNLTPNAEGSAGHQETGTPAALTPTTDTSGTDGSADSAVQQETGAPETVATQTPTTDAPAIPSAADSPVQQENDTPAALIPTADAPTTPGAEDSADSVVQQETTAPSTRKPTTDAPAPTTDAPTTTDASATTDESAATDTPAASDTASSATTPSAASNSSTADNSKLCAKPRVRITKVDVGVAVDANEDEVNLKVVAIAALPSGGSRIAFHSGKNVIVQELDGNDELVSSSSVEVPLHDFADIYADKDGFVILGTRDAEGGGTLNCGNPSNLCGTAPSPAVPCYDMYMVRYDGSKETWATKLTSSSASLPPYSSSKTGPDVYMIWWYAHHGRIASDGTNWAAYFGAAISTSEGGCINIHQGDRMKVVDPSGKITADEDSFDWGCSHSAYERITYDNRTDSYATICKTDSNNRIMPPKDWDTTIYPVDLAAANLGDIVPDADASSNKYWATVSNGEGDNAKVHLIHFATNAAASEDITLGGSDANERAPHLASIGDGGLLATWEGSSSGGDLTEGGARTMYAQVLDASTGKSISEKVTLDKSVVGNRYQALKSFPDGSVAYLSKGTTGTSLQVVRFFGC